jgi:hypothetical protein
MFRRHERTNSGSKTLPKTLIASQLTELRLRRFHLDGDALAGEVTMPFYLARSRVRGLLLALAGLVWLWGWIAPSRLKVAPYCLGGYRCVSG